MSQLKAPRQLYKRSQTFLLKKYRDAPSDLSVADEKIIYFDDLFGMNKVSNVAFFINTTIKISCTCFSVRSSWNQNIGDFSALDKDLETINIPLNDRQAPFSLNLVLLEFFHESHVPRKPILYAHGLVLERLCKVILVWKIKSVSQNFINLSYFLENLFSLRSRRQLSIT